jgi:uncharacterized OsmC-like protein
MTTDLRSIQRPIKERYRNDPGTAKITLRASGAEGEAPIACSVEVGRAIHEAQAHEGAGGAGTGACSGDLLLGALAACAQITCQMVASAMGIDVVGIRVEVEGDLDMRGTLGVSKEVPVGFQEIRLDINIDAPSATAEEIDSLREKTHRYCVVFQTLKDPPSIGVTWGNSGS